MQSQLLAYTLYKKSSITTPYNVHCKSSISTYVMYFIFQIAVLSLWLLFHAFVRFVTISFKQYTSMKSPCQTFTAHPTSRFRSPKSSASISSSNYGSVQLSRMVKNPRYRIVGNNWSSSVWRFIMYIMYNGHCKNRHIGHRIVLIVHRNVVFHIWFFVSSRDRCAVVCSSRK